MNSIIIFMSNKKRNEILCVISKCTRCCRSNTCREWVCPCDCILDLSKAMSKKSPGRASPMVENGMLAQTRCLCNLWPWAGKHHLQKALTAVSLLPKTTQSRSPLAEIPLCDYLAISLFYQSIINATDASASPSELIAHQIPALCYLCLPFLILHCSQSGF